MVGNDVVDLADPDTRAEARHPRFDARVFDAGERALIESSPAPERTRWLLWAAKESAYKAARQGEPRIVFSPARFVVRREDGGRTVVTVGDRQFRVETAADAEHVHAVARPAEDPAGPVYAAVGGLADAGPAGLAVRRLAIDAIARRLGLAPDAVAIGRDGRIPTLWIGGRRSTADLSLSHHGRFVAFACTLPETVA
jgi:phosphopantetheinyl transferase (holo-ACP synthase)